MKRLLLATAAVLALGILAQAADNINKSLQLSQDPTSGFGVSTPLGLFVPQHLHTNDSKTPSISTFGTSPIITGTDFAGEVDEGTGSVTSGVLTFAQAYTATPYCTATGSSTTTPVGLISTPAGFTLSHIASAVQMRWYYHCIGARAQ